MPNSEKITADDFQRLRKVKRQKHKFGAIKCERDGLKFPSKLERNCFDRLKQLQKEGKILFFLMQVPFYLPSNKKHYVDFCVFTENEVIFIESKGRDLPLGKFKREQAEALFPVKIHVVKKVSDIDEVVQA